MGQRANLIVIEHAERMLYYDHWCANRLDDELFWGPRFALDFVRQLDPVDDSMWLDDVWCEGAAVIDVDAKSLLWFGGEDTLYEIPRRRLFLELMERNWPGWVIRWADEGIMSVADCLGLPRDRFIGAPAVDPGPPELEYRDDSPDANNLLFTWTFADGRRDAKVLSGFLDAIEIGPHALAVIADRAPPMTLPCQLDRMPRSGAHDRRLLGRRTRRPCDPRPPPRLARLVSRLVEGLL